MIALNASAVSILKRKFPAGPILRFNSVWLELMMWGWGPESTYRQRMDAYSYARFQSKRYDLGKRKNAPTARECVAWAVSR